MLLFYNRNKSPHTTANSGFWSEQSEEQNRNLRLLEEEDASGNVNISSFCVASAGTIRLATACKFELPLTSALLDHTRSLTQTEALSSAVCVAACCCHRTADARTAPLFIKNITRPGLQKL